MMNDYCEKDANKGNKEKNIRHEKPSFRTKVYVKILKQPFLRPVFPFFEKANLLLFHSDLRQKTIKGTGENNNTYYVRRGAGKNDIAGLVGTYYLVGGAAYSAIREGQIPYVDFQKYKCQYSVDREINGTTNAWEYYFEQPCGTQRTDVEKGRKIILSGWEFHKSREKSNNLREWGELSRKERRAFFESTMPIKQYIRDEVWQIYNRDFSGRNVLGLFLRGTDYTARKPVGHAVQPTVMQACDKVREFLQKYRIDRIFLVTEDADIYDQVKHVFGDMVFCSDYNFIRFDGRKDKWVKDAFHNDPYERGKNYLIRVMLLSMCKYYVGSQASGSRFALDFSNYDDEYTFDLGLY